MVFKKIKEIFNRKLKKKRSPKDHHKTYLKVKKYKKKVHTKILKRKYNLSKKVDREKLLLDFKLKDKFILLDLEISKIKNYAKEKNRRLNNAETLKIKFLENIMKDINTVFKALKEIEKIQSKTVTKKDEVYLEKLKSFILYNKLPTILSQYNFYEKEIEFKLKK